MATGMEMAMQAALPILKKMIPPEVWQAVETNIVSLTAKVADVEKRLAGIEENQRLILKILLKEHGYPINEIDEAEHEPHSTTSNGHHQF